MRNQICYFLQFVLALAGLLILILLVRLPLTEGRAVHLNLLQIYSDPFIWYGYLIAALYYFALFKMIRVIGLYRISQHTSKASLESIKSIKNTMLICMVLVGLAGFYIVRVHSKEDDPAGFLALCIMVIFCSSLITLLSARLLKRWTS